MKILLVNPNRYHHPPVVPIGLEYLMGALAGTGHEAVAADLCFVADPAQTLRDMLDEYAPDVAGISVRQIDTCLYRNNEFFLDDIALYVAVCHDAGIPVVLGGSGFSIMAEAILDYTGADYGVVGPGERALPALLDSPAGRAEPSRVLDGHGLLNDRGGRFPRVKAGDYGPYLAREGIAGFRTQIGCAGSCFFCTESSRAVVFHDPEAVGAEVAGLKRCGSERLHLCDSEFNQDLTHCMAVCRAIRERAGGIDWALYMKPEPCSEQLFDALAESGATMITLSIDTLNHAPGAHAGINRFFSAADGRNIKAMVDLSVGYPHEARESVERMFDLLEARPAGSVGVNSYFRIYPGTLLHRQCLDDRSLKSCLLDWVEGTDLVHPSFFRWFTEDDLETMAGGREAFRIEGRDQATNYQRAAKSGGKGAGRHRR